jgi:hypothetical protein
MTNYGPISLLTVFFESTGEGYVQQVKPSYAYKKYISPRTIWLQVMEIYKKCHL